MKSNSVLTIVCKPCLFPAIVSLSLFSSVSLKTNLYILCQWAFLFSSFQLSFINKRDQQKSQGQEEREIGGIIPLVLSLPVAEMAGFL